MGKLYVEHQRATFKLPKRRCNCVPHDPQSWKSNCPGTPTGQSKSGPYNARGLDTIDVAVCWASKPPNYLLLLLQETYLAKHMQKHADRTDKRPPIVAGPPGTMAQDLYWPKMDPSLYQGHERLDPYGQGLMDPTRFHQQFAEDLRHQGPYGMGGGGWGDPSKPTSAFSPINTGVLPTSTGFNMGSGTRGYPFYDPISFQRQSQV